MTHVNIERTTSTEFSDEDWLLINDFLQGEESAFGSIFEKYKKKVINLAFRFLKEAQSAEDIAQEVFIRIYEKKIRYDPRAKFTTLLYRITVNASLDLIRRRKFFPISLDQKIQNKTGNEQTFIESLPSLKASSSGETLDRDELKVCLQKEIHQLPENLKSPLLLYQFEEMPYGDIAQVLGITTKAVERRIYRAKGELRKKLAKYIS